MEQRSRVVVTGATGLIGRPLTRRLIEDGYSVIVFSRDPERARLTIPGAAAYVAWQPEIVGPWAAYLDGVAGIIHMAAPPLFERRISRTEFQAARRVRIESTANLVRAMAQAQVRPGVFISSSAVGAYGMSRRDEREVTEQSEPIADDWAEGAATWERTALAAESLGIRTVIVRTGVVLGYDGGALVAQLPQDERGFGAVVLPGTEWMPWIHITDEVGIIMRCLEDERMRGPVNASAPYPARQRDFARTVGRALGRPVRLRIPGTVLKMFMGEPARAILYNHRMIPQKMLDVGYTFVFPRLEEAVSDIIAHRREHA
jgi:uncharacterized protein (TIGR01777 family)